VFTSTASTTTLSASRLGEPIDLAAAARTYQRNRRRTDPNDRFHPVGDDIFPSVTGLIHAVLKSPGLEAWLLNGRLATYRQDLLQALSAAQTPQSIKSAVRDTPFPYRGRDMGNAAEIGTNVHRAIEWALKGEMGLEPGEMPDLGPIEADCFARWSAWWPTSGLKPLALEQQLVCRGCGYAGHADLIAEVEATGRQVVVDYKTSKAARGPASALPNLNGPAVFPDYYLQLAAYGHVARIPLGAIVRIGKDPDEDVEVTWVEDLPSIFPMFTNMLTMWRWLRGLSGHDTGTPPTGDHTLEGH
jgi:hypothetical protein